MAPTDEPRTEGSVAADSLSSGAIAGMSRDGSLKLKKTDTFNNNIFQFYLYLVFCQHLSSPYE